MKRLLLSVSILLLAFTFAGATDNISDESYTLQYGVRSRTANTHLGYRYFEARPITADTDLSTVDTLRVVRDFNGDGIVDSLGASPDYAPICRIDLWSNAPVAAKIDTCWVKYFNGTAAGTATATDSIIVTFGGTAEAMSPAVQSLFVRADYAVVGGGASVGAGDLWVIAYCER
jgi:hypothetical protein